SDMRRFDPAALLEKYGLTPAQYPDFAALRGDNSDNLPGIPGVGEKTATKWIVEVGALDELVHRVGEGEGGAGGARRAALGNGRGASGTRGLPVSMVGATPRDLVPEPWDREKIHQLFDTLQFRVLRTRLYEYLPDGIAGVSAPGHPHAAGTAGDAGGFEVETSLLGPDEVAGWLDEHQSSERSGLAVTGTWGRGTGNLTGIAIAAPDGAGAFLDPEALTPADEEAFAAWLESAQSPKAMHEAKGPMHAFAARGFALGGLTSDTALAAYLALPGQREFDLADLALRYLGKELRDSSADGQPEQLTLDGSGEQESAVALALRARATLDLAAALDADLDKRGARRLLEEIELPLVDVLAQMERTGIAADAEHFAEMSATLQAEVKSAEQAAYKEVGHEFNLGSPKQLQEVLVTELDVPKTTEIKTR